MITKTSTTLTLTLIVGWLVGAATTAVGGLSEAGSAARATGGAGGLIVMEDPSMSPPPLSLGNESLVLSASVGLWVTTLQVIEQIIEIHTCRNIVTVKQLRKSG